MKLEGQNIILETIEETADVFFGPTEWDFKAGGRKCAFYAAFHKLGMDEEDAEQVQIKILDPHLENYWKGLEKSSLKDFSDFDFLTGLEDSRFSNSPRDKNHPSLLMAQHICERGIGHYQIQKINGVDYQAIEFIDTDTTQDSFFLKTLMI